MTDFVVRETHIIKLEYCTEKFLKTFKNTDCQDCYEDCAKTNKDVCDCISEHFKNYLIIDKKSDFE